MLDNKRFLVLGSNSFSGASFVDHLSALGCDVLAASRSPEPHRALLPYKWERRPGDVRFHRIDLNHDLDALAQLLKDERPTHVVNFAAQSMVAQSWDHPEDWMRTNVVSTVRLLAMLSGYDGLDRYVQVTTPEVYGSTDGWVTEDHPYNPSTPYAISRAAGDMSLKAYVENFDLPGVSTRAANVYGPGQPLYRIIPRTILAAMTGETLRLDGGGVSRRVFIHIADVADATLKVALNGRPGHCYHVSGDELVTIRGLVESILAAMGASFEACVKLGPERPGKDQAYMLDSKKIRDELGWTDRIGLEEGLADTIAWARRFESELGVLPTRYEHKP